MTRHFTPLLTRAIVLLASLATLHAENRSIDGTGNAPGDKGAANTPFLRLSAVGYENGFSTLAGPGRPNARDISNLLSDQNESEPNCRGGSDYIWQWGQFLDHDITLSPADTGQDASIAITDEEDVLYNASFPFIPMGRTNFITDGSGVRQQVNAITSFIDASNVYGSNPTTATALRSFTAGRMKAEPDGMLPYNTAGLPMGTIGLVPSNELRMAGDVRANEQSCLTAMHTLFVSEHNRLDAEIATNNPSWNDEQIYQRARKIVGALIQSITYNEWLPALLGAAAPAPSTFSYDSAVDPSISNEFATALFRFGHTMVSPQLMRIHDDNFPDGIPSRSLMNSFFYPPAIESPAAYEYLLKGLACQLHQDADARIIPELRNTLFGPVGSGGMDLAALNIQRGRDHGLADYNTVRASYGLPPKTTWADLSSDPLVQADYAATYADINDLDLWTAALSEDHLPDASVGETIAVSLAAEFTRLAKGDRFFYLWDADLSPALRTQITWTSLSNIIGRNTSLSPQYNVFFIPEYNLAINSIAYRPGIGVELTFMGKPGCAYQIKHGTSPTALTNDLLGEPITTGESTYMLQCTDPEATGIGERYYQVVETLLP
jgi:peroxidase